MKITKIVAGLTFGIVGIGCTLAQAQTIQGAGSSAAAPIYRSWGSEYQKASGMQLNYESIGSSAGIKRIVSRSADFGASDVPPSEADQIKQGLTIFPIAVTGIAPVVNLPKVGDAQLRLTGRVLARIFLGEILRWNASEIVELNPGLSLPDMAIKVIVRSDGSGTTFNFADYLSKVNTTWKTRYGAKSTLAWPESFIGVTGSDGVVAAIKDNVGAIGYVDHGYVKENHLRVIQLKNSSGDYLAPSPTGFRAALVASEWNTKGKFNGTLTDMAGRDSWPITMGTFVVVPTVSEKTETTQNALRFFVWAFLNGDALVQKSNFVRLPDRIQAAVFKSISSIKDKSGASIGVGLM